MNIYALFPLIATIAYIPLLVTTIRNKPWKTQHKLFIIYISAAMIWSLTAFLFRSNFFPQHKFLLLQIIIIIYTLTIAQFYRFTSSFFPSAKGRWLPLAYSAVAIAIVLVVLGYTPESVIVSGDKLYPVYGIGWFFLSIPLVILLGRIVYLFWKRLKVLDNPVLHNQITSLLVGIFVLATFTFATLLIPWAKEFPISHFGNLITAFILSYATIRHELVDIRLVLRRALAWTTLGIIGGASYWLSLVALQALFHFELDFIVMAIATAAAASVAIFIYTLRGALFTRIGKALHGPSYDYRKELSNIAQRIHNVFSFREQGGELLTLVTKAIGCKEACLLFVEAGSEDFTTQLVEPNSVKNPLSHLRWPRDNPIVEYFGREHKPLTRQDLAIRPEFSSLWEAEKKAIKSKDIELLIPLISRNRLVGILTLGRKQSGKYMLEDFRLLEEVAKQAAVSIEKEYLQEQLR